MTKKAGLVDEAGSIPRLNRILLADSVATMVGAVAGTSTVTSYIESASGVAVGGRTGLTSVVVGILFFCTLFVAPLVQAIPTAALTIGGAILVDVFDVGGDVAKIVGAPPRACPVVVAPVVK